MNTASTSTAPTQTGWFCLRTQPRREQVAALNLAERVRVDVFAPRIRVTRTVRGLLASAAEALFPGYVFARFRYPDQARHVASTTGVTGLVTFGGPPPVVEDRVIEFLRAQAGSALHDAQVPLFEEGTWVRITSGAFHDAEGKVVHFDPRTERVRLLLTLLGREIQISLPAQQLMAASRPRGQYPSGLLCDTNGQIRAAS